MSREWSESEIITFIKKDLLLERLDLADTGLTLADIHDDTSLLGDEGLALDSVDALDLLVNVEKTFSLKTLNLDKTFIDTTCQSVRSLTDFIVAELRQSGGLKAEVQHS